MFLFGNGVSFPRMPFWVQGVPGERYLTVPTKTQRTQTFWEPLGKTILKETRKV